MDNYTVCVPYVAWKYYEVEAESEEKAIEKAFDENDIEDVISLCWSCNENIDSELVINEEDIYVEKNND